MTLLKVFESTIITLFKTSQATPCYSQILRYVVHGSTLHNAMLKSKQQYYLGECTLHVTINNHDNLEIPGNKIVTRIQKFTDQPFQQYRHD